MPKTVARPSPVPLPGSFVVKNGSKMRAKFSGAMPQPVSVTRRQTWRPGEASGIAAASSSVKTLLSGFNEEPSAAGHGVACVDDEVKEHLVEHPGIRAGDEGSRVEIELQTHILADDALQHLGQAGDDFIQVQQRAAASPAGG